MHLLKIHCMFTNKANWVNERYMVLLQKDFLDIFAQFSTKFYSLKMMSEQSTIHLIQTYHTLIWSCKKSPPSVLVHHLPIFSEKAAALFSGLFCQSFSFCWIRKAQTKVFVQLYACHTVRKKSPYSELFWSPFFPHFPAFGLNTERYSVSLRIQSECRKMREKYGPE